MMTNWWNNGFWVKKEKEKDGESGEITYEEHLRRAGMREDEVDERGKRKAAPREDDTKEYKKHIKRYERGER
uniref:Uncharacterized protein n=2 Tax=viral metagenome TaxID=1070528 RepID=A0A6M3KHT4_9ZZZZ